MWVSLTSVGPRKNHLKRAVTALLAQRAVTLTGVLLTLPTTSHRPKLPPYTDADCAELAALSPLVQIHRPAVDLGPAMKYCGPEEAVSQYHGPVFVGDDDQRYHPQLLQRLQQRLQQYRTVSSGVWPPVLQNRLEATRTCTKGGLVRGFAGLVINAPFHLLGFADFVARAPPECRVVDDDLFSVFLWLRGVSIERGVSKHAHIFIDGQPEDDIDTALHHTTPRAAATAAVFAWGQWPPEAVQCPPKSPVQHWISPFHLKLAYSGCPVVVREVGVPGPTGQLEKALQASIRPVQVPGCTAVVFFHQAGSNGDQLRAYSTIRRPETPLVLVPWPAHPQTVRAATQQAGVPHDHPAFPAGDLNAPVRPILVRHPRPQPLPLTAEVRRGSAPAERRFTLPSGRQFGRRGRGEIAVWGSLQAQPQRVVQTGTAEMRELHAVELANDRVLALFAGVAVAGRRPQLMLCDMAARKTVLLVIRDSHPRRRPSRAPAIPSSGVRLFVADNSLYCVVSYDPLCILKVVNIARGICSVLCGSVNSQRKLFGGTAPVAWGFPQTAAIATRGKDLVPVLLNYRAGNIQVSRGLFPTVWGIPISLTPQPPANDFELQCSTSTVWLRYEDVCALFS